MKTLLPIGLKYSPIEKLAIISFEKKPDIIYKSFELQYLNSNDIGKGFRVLAYRNDGYIDMYDDLSLNFNPDEKCDVAEKGLYKHIHTSIDNANFEKNHDCIYISFNFEDLLGRKVHVYIKEQNKRKNTPMNMLAPIGFGSQNPTYLPVFFLYEFDFIKRRNTRVDIQIDNKPIKQDKFFFPISGQTRYFSKYALETQILEFVPLNPDIKQVAVDENLQYLEGPIKYQFVETMSGLGLSKIELMHEKKVVIDFAPELTLEDGAGEFFIRPPDEMGHIRGMYRVKRYGNFVEFYLTPDKGWTSVPNSFITKIILSPKSVFSNWSKKYEYSALIDLSKMKIDGKWVNGNQTKVLL